MNGGALVPYESKAPSENFQSHGSETRNPSTGLFTFCFETRSEKTHDRRIFQVEERSGKWRVSSAWQAEGIGKLPFAFNILRRHPDILNRAANLVLYDFDSILQKVVRMTDTLVSRIMPLLPYDDGDVE